jgi:membrane associated rhomboid family serine protease
MSEEQPTQHEEPLPAEGMVYPDAPLPETAVPTPYFTYILAGSIIAVALLQFITDSQGPRDLERVQHSILAAGFVKPFFLHGEYWRILTGATVHAGVAHIAFNSMALVSFGRLVEMLSSRAHLAIVLVLSAIGGGIVSLIFKPDVISVGASGGIIGLLGYLVVYSMRRRQFISPEFRRSLLFNTGFIVVYGLVLYQVIDNFAHLGGFLTGAVYALFQVPGDPYKDPRDTGTVARIAGWAAFAIFVATCGFSVLLILTY